MILLAIVLALLISIINAFLYRFGGISKEQGKNKYPWVPEWCFNSKARDVGISLTTLVWLVIFYPKVDWYVYLVTFGLTWASLSTYWDQLFNKDNFWFHGFGVGLAKVLFPISTGLWVGFITHCFLSAILMGSISAISKDDDVEELGRGSIIGLTLLNLLIPN